jgi:RNA polymerase sigma-70 factor (ECF subfamily)
MSSAMPERPDHLSTRKSLLRRLKDCEDQASWREFYHVYGDLISRFALKAGLTETEAEEVVQETTIAVARHLAKFTYDPAKCSFKTWLLNQTTWRIQDQLRKRGKAGSASFARRSGSGAAGSDDETRRTGTIERIPDHAESAPDALWEKDWEQAILEIAMQRVKARANLKDCQIFDLHILRQMPVREVARTLNVSASRVYLAKHRIGRLVKREVERLRAAGD